MKISSACSADPGSSIGLKGGVEEQVDHREQPKLSEYDAQKTKLVATVSVSFARGDVVRWCSGETKRMESMEDI